MSLHVRFFIIFAFIIGIVFQAAFIDAYKKVGVRPYIVGGRDSKIEAHPYQVLIEIVVDENTLRCSGSIISESHILTAAHCLHDRSANGIGLWYGITNQEQRGEKYSVKHIDIHPMYDPETTDYDVGVIWPTEKIPLNNHTIKTIGYADSSYVMKPDSEVTVSGWGKLWHDGASASTLQQVKVKVIKWEICKELFEKGYGDVITERMWCAGDLVKGGTDACQGDSGAAAVQSDQIVGLVSWSRDCALPNAPGVYTNIAKVRPWIDAQKLK